MYFTITNTVLLTAADSLVSGADSDRLLRLLGVCQEIEILFKLQLQQATLSIKQCNTFIGCLQ